MEYIMSIKSELIGMLKQFFVLSFVIALISSLIIQAIKKTDDNVFKRKKLNSVTIWRVMWY